MVDQGREAEDARLDRGLSYEAVGRALALSGEQVAPICRGESPEVSLLRIAELLEVVGLELGQLTWSRLAAPVGCFIR